MLGSYSYFEQAILLHVLKARRGLDYRLELLVVIEVVDEPSDGHV